MRERLAGVEGVRAIAALMVLFFHTWLWGDPAGDGFGLRPVDHTLRYFYLGVTVFFVLSGFLLYRPFVSAALRGQAMPDLRRYFVKRVLRIVPGFWLCVYTWSLLAYGGLPPLSENLKNFLFLQIYWPHSNASANLYWPNMTHAIIVPAWTLCLEISFYAALPLVALLIWRFARGGTTTNERVLRQLLALSALVGAGLLYKALSLLYPWRLPVALPEVIDLFAIGMALAVVVEWHSLRSFPQLGRRAVWTANLAAVALLVVAAQVADRNVLPKPQSSGFATILFQPLIALVAAVLIGAMLLAERKTLLLRFCSLRAMFWLGTISYGIYLWHLEIRLVAGTFMPDPHGQPPLQAMAYWLAGSMAVLALTVGAAWLSWIGVERRMLALKGRVFDRTPTATPAARPSAR